MDELVRQAMAKWPHVPHCYDWLALDARGRWRLRDDRTQAAGPFAGAGSNADSKGSVVRHEALMAFIGRNYAPDEHGCWFFQNGPQRVYVELEVAPWVLRLGDEASGFAVSTHTGCPVVAESAWCDEQGRAYLLTDAGFGLVHTLDTLHMADAIECGHWLVQGVDSGELPARFGFVPSPARVHAGAAKAGPHVAR